MSTPELAAPSRAPCLDRGEALPALSDTNRKRRLRGMVMQHHATLWGFLRRLGLDDSDADDAIQEVLLVAIRKLDGIDPRFERGFLLRTAYRIGCRLRAKRPQVGTDDLTDPVPHPDVLVDQKRARELLDEILARMSEELCAVFVLHDIVRLTMAEIAEALDLKPGTVASRLRRARADFDKRVARVEAGMNHQEVGR
ncbi:MAG: sigma-70 family RNA polymerase sigma factor [Deltaproteobacteria bacterium]|nr:sigma-70 family RNA polymerase sigma factor [Deltaproteobacteria bacterium]